MHTVPNAGVRDASRAQRHARGGALIVLWLGLVLAGCGPTGRATLTPQPNAVIRVGAVFPLTGNAAGLAGQELAGVRAAAEFVNADGGLGGRKIVLEVRDLPRAADAPGIMKDLRSAGVAVVIGAYASSLSIPASRAASDAGLVYWEAGAVADQLTGDGLPLVFRVGASGSNLGANSARFAASELAPRLGGTPGSTRVAIVAANDAYATSVAEAARSTSDAAGLEVVANLTYDLTRPDFPATMMALQEAAPDIVILASHIPDGVAFRQAMLAAKLTVGALIGSTMAECDPDFAGALGRDAIGIFASDRPTGGFRSDALSGDARALYERFAAAWPAGLGGDREYGSSGYGSGSYGSTSSLAPGSSASTWEITGPVEEGSSDAGPTEEGLSGFSAAWVLFRDVLPAAGPGHPDSEAIAQAARALDLPTGSLPNGAGVRFSTDRATLGQNELAAAVIWQWQAVRSYTFVWPATYQTGEISFVPLDR